MGQRDKMPVRRAAGQEAWVDADEDQVFSEWKRILYVGKVEDACHAIVDEAMDVQRAAWRLNHLAHCAPTKHIPEAFWHDHWITEFRAALAAVRACEQALATLAPLAPQCIREPDAPPLPEMADVRPRHHWEKDKGHDTFE